MPEFKASEAKTAIADITNLTAKAFDYSAHLYFGVGQAALAITEFHLEPGETKPVNFQIIMPSVLATYSIYLDVYANGNLLRHYEAEESVVITLPAEPEPPEEWLRLAPGTWTLWISEEDQEYIFARDLPPGQLAQLYVPTVESLWNTVVNAYTGDPRFLWGYYGRLMEVLKQYIADPTLFWETYNNLVT